MKMIVRLIPLFLLVVISESVFSQERVCDKLLEANQAFCQKAYKKEAKILEKDYHSSFLAIDSHLNIRIAMANAWRKAGKMKKAKKHYLAIIAYSDYPTEESVFLPIRCEKLNTSCGAFIKPNRMLENQHESNIEMAKFYLKKKKFNKAFFYIENADIYQRYWYGCGTGDLENDLRLSLLYADYYSKQKMVDSALMRILPNALEASAMPVPYYSDIVKETVKLLKSKYKRDALKTVLENAVEGLFYKPYKGMHGEEKREYFIRIDGIDIKVAPDYLMANNTNIEEVKSYIRQSEFYKLCTR